MENRVLSNQAGQYVEAHGRKKRWLKVVTALAAIAVFCTTYALIMPAVTMQGKTHCGYEEHKEHSDKCYEQIKKLTCTLSEEGHKHTAQCYSEKRTLICEIEETEGHQHTDSCYSEEQILVCENDSPDHVHDESCYATHKVLICENAEYPEHHHDESCYTTQLVLTCEKEEQEPHRHTEECYTVVADTEHLTCKEPIHTHTLQCYSDPEADVEKAEIWEKTFEDVTLSGNWSRDFLAIAETQIGYAESTSNYEVQANGTSRKGYSRYGAWYGIPYGDWCAMFCSFCLSYAGVDSKLMPFDANCPNWIAKLSDEKLDLYHPAGDYVPKPGDLVFFDWDSYDPRHIESRSADHVGLVKELVYDSETKALEGIKTIEGNSGNQVAVRSYKIDHTALMGYGSIPQNPDWFTMHAETESGIQVTVEGLKDALPEDIEEMSLSAEEISNEQSAELLESQLEQDGNENMDAILMDVSLWHDDKAVEPVGPVYLSFVAPEVDTDAAVYHIDEQTETVTTMETEINEFEGTVSLETDHFSTYALVLNPVSGKSVTANVSAEWDSDGKFKSAAITATSDAQTCFNYDVCIDGNWTIGAGTWTGKIAANTPVSIDITEAVNHNPLDTVYRARVAEQTDNPTNNKSGYSEQFTIYDFFESAKPGFTDWAAGPYEEFFGGTRPTTADALFTAFGVYQNLPSLTLTSGMENNELIVAANLDETGLTPITDPVYQWEYYDDTNREWVTLSGEQYDTLNATAYSSLTEGAQPVLDGGKTVRCKVYDGEDLKAVATLPNVNPLQELYDQAIAVINRELDLSAFPWYLQGTKKGGSGGYHVSDVHIGGQNFNDYFYYDNVARDANVPFSDAQSYANYLASEYLAQLKLAGANVTDDEQPSAAVEYIRSIWNKYIFDLYNPNPSAGVVENYSYYPAANGSGPISTYGDHIIEWPKDNGSSFHNTTTNVDKNTLINDLSYDFLEGGVDYSRFIESLDKTATADAAGDFNTNRSYDIDITAKTQATSVSPLALLVTVQTSWQMFDYPHANCVAGDGTYTTIEVGGAQHNTEMANLYEIKQALLDFITYMDENFPGHNLVLGVNEVQHGGSYNMIQNSVTTTVSGKSTTETVYVSNNSDLLRQSIYNWDSFGNCEHVHYDTDAMEAAAENLDDNLTGWTDINGDRIQSDDINKVSVIIGGGTENTNGTNGYGCALPWGTFYGSGIDAVYGIRTNVGEPLNTDGVLSWLDYYKNNTGNPYSLDAEAGYSTGSATGNFTGKYVATTRDAVYNTLVKIAQKELKSKGIKVQDESKNIENVTISDTVNDEFRIEENKPFVATVFDKRGNKVYETVITPTAYSDAGAITAASATFTVYNTDGTEKSTVTPTVTVAQNGTETTLSVPVNIPYSYTPAGEEAVPVSGTEAYNQTLKINRKSNKTTDVAYDFGTVYNTNDAKLHFEVIARDDYIGSNNVFTNEGTPDVSFRHAKLNRDGQRIDENGRVLADDEPSFIVPNDVESYDTPEVNVPVRFTADDGGSVTVEVKTPVNLEDLSTTAGGTAPTLPEGYTGSETDIADSEYITATVHDLIDNYDQINGTVSYTWVTPGGKQYPVPVTLHVTGGIPDDDITAASEMAQQWTPKTAGIYDVVLKVTFTPDPVEDKGNFADDGGVTVTRVTKLEREGHESIIVTAPQGGTTSNDTTLTVTKVWAGEKGDTTKRPQNGITFNIFQDGEFYDQQTVKSADGWSYTFTGLPYMDTDTKKPYVYSVTEDNVPNYETTYEALQTVYHPPYWEEVPLNELDLDGGVEYLIVQKDTKQAINPDAVENLFPVTILTELDPESDEFVTPPSGLPEDTESYFPDSSYRGWYIKYTADGNNAQNSYVKSAASESPLYLRKQGDLSRNTSDDSKLSASPSTNGKLKLNNNFLKINESALENVNDAGATAFTYYAKYGNYWAEIPLSDLDLTGGTEYLLVDKDKSKAVAAGSSAPSVVGISGLMQKAEGAVEKFPDEIDDDSETYIPDNGYQGWHIKYTNGTDNANNYIESASEDTTLYIKKPANNGSCSESTSNDTRLALEPTSDGKIKLNDNYLKITSTNDGYKLVGDGQLNNGSVFAFYQKVESTAPPTYRSTVTNTYIPGGERQNQTSITVNKEWLNSDSTTEITIHLLQNGKVIDTCTLNSTIGWTHTFDTLPGTTTRLPYFDPLTGEPYVYTVEEDVISGYETGYTKTAVHDAAGGLHYLLYTQTGGTPGLYDDTAYVLTTPIAIENGSTTTADYMVGYTGNAGTFQTATISTNSFAYGNLTGDRELTGTVDSQYVWTVETNSNDTTTFHLRRNGYYVGVKNDGTVVFSGAPNEKDTSYDWKLDATNNKLYALAGKNHNTPKYLKVKPTYNDKAPKVLKSIAYATDGDASKATAFTIFEGISLQSGYDTYSYKVQNISTGTSSSDGKVVYAKKIDYLADNIETTSTENPDTALCGNYYRLYLDAVGVRDAGAEKYPTFKGVYITDHLSQYVTLAEHGSEIDFQITKVSTTDPDNVTPLWYGDLNPATGAVGSVLAKGKGVIKSVVYTRADETETDSTGSIRVDFDPDYCLEEGYRYVISYNVEASDYAMMQVTYPDGSVGAENTDYDLVNPTSSGMPGFHSNSVADIVYTQDGDVKIGIYEHPVIQVLMGYELPETGGTGTIPYTLCGIGLMAAALMYGFSTRRKRERRYER